MLQGQDLDLLHEHFAPLSRKQLEICIHHAFGVPKAITANSYNMSIDTVKQNVKRSAQKMGMEDSESLRIAILMRTFGLMINKLNTPKLHTD